MAPEGPILRLLLGSVTALAFGDVGTGVSSGSGEDVALVVIRVTHGGFVPVEDLIHVVV